MLLYDDWCRHVGTSVPDGQSFYAVMDNFTWMVTEYVQLGICVALKGDLFFLILLNISTSCVSETSRQIISPNAKGVFFPSIWHFFCVCFVCDDEFLGKGCVRHLFFFSNQMLIVLKWLENDFWSQDLNGLCHEYTVTKHNVHSLYKRVQARVLILFFKSLNWGLHLLERQMFCTDFNHEYAIKILSLDNKVLWVVICAIDHIKNWSKAVILCDVRMPFS